MGRLDDLVLSVIKISSQDKGHTNWEWPFSCKYIVGQAVLKNYDTVAITGNEYLHRIGLAKWRWAKLNNTVNFVYICAAVCIVCYTTIWRQAGLSGGFVDFLVILLNFPRKMSDPMCGPRTCGKLYF